MDMKTLLASAILSLFAVGLSWGLNQLSDQFRLKREWCRKLKELRIENYAELRAGMRESLVRYASQTNGEQYKAPICEERLQIVESDPIALKLIREVRASIPDSGTSDYNALRESVQSDPEWEWKPFEDKMNELLVHIRRLIS